MQPKSLQPSGTHKTSSPPHKANGTWSGPHAAAAAGSTAAAAGPAIASTTSIANTNRDRLIAPSLLSTARASSRRVSNQIIQCPCSPDRLLELVVIAISLVVHKYTSDSACNEHHGGLVISALTLEYRLGDPTSPRRTSCR